MNTETPNPNQTSIALAAQLFLTHFVTGGIALLTIYWLDITPSFSQFTLTMAACGTIGFLLTLNLQRTIRLVDWSLVYLTTMLPVPPLPQRGHGPLTSLPAKLQLLAEREKPFHEIREHQLQQASESAAQEERHRLARDLHDSIKQQLFSIRVSIAAVQARWQQDPAGAQEALTDVRQSAQAALVEMNALLHQLSPAPLEKVGLVQALQEQCEALGYRSGAEVTCTIGELPANNRFPHGAQETIFRIAQEALSNIARHARATQVTLNLQTKANHLQLDIQDNGQGFSPTTTNEGMGLSNIRQRAQNLSGICHLTSATGQGTHLSIVIPLQETFENLKEQIMYKTDHTLNRIGLISLSGAFALVLILFYPLYVVFPGFYLDTWFNQSQSISFIFPTMAILSLSMLGYIGARAAHTPQRKHALTTGAFTSSIAGIFAYLLLLLPALAVMGNTHLFQHGLLPASDESQFLWLVGESIINIISWGLGSFWVVAVSSALLGTIGAYFAPLNTTSPSRFPFASPHYPAIVRTAFSAATMVSYLAFTFTLLSFSLLGHSVEDAGIRMAADGFIFTLPALNTSIVPILTTSLIFLLSILGFYASVRYNYQQASSKGIMTRLYLTYFMTYLSSLISFLLLTVDIQPDSLKQLTTIFGFCNFAIVLLLGHLAYILEQQIPLLPNLPSWFTPIHHFKAPLAMILVLLVWLAGITNFLTMFLLLTTFAIILMDNPHRRLTPFQPQPQSRWIKQIHKMAGIIQLATFTILLIIFIAQLAFSIFTSFTIADSFDLSSFGLLILLLTTFLRFASNPQRRPLQLSQDSYELTRHIESLTSNIFALFLPIAPLFVVMVNVYNLTVTPIPFIDPANVAIPPYTLVDLVQRAYQYSALALLILLAIATGLTGLALLITKINTHDPLPAPIQPQTI